MGAPRPRPLAVRHRSHHSVDRLRERQGRRLRRGADVVGGPVRAPDARRVGGPRARPPALHDPALRKHTQGTTDLTVTAPANEALVGPTVDVTGTAAPGSTVSVAVTNIDPGPPGDDGDRDHGRRRRRVQRHRPDRRRHVDPQHRGHEPVRGHRTRGADGLARVLAGDAAVRGRRPAQRRQRTGQLRLSDERQLQAGRVRPRGVPGLRRRRPDRLPGPHARPDADVREPARRPARRRLRPRARRVIDLHGGVVRAAQLRDRGERRLEPADRGPGLRPAVRRRRGQHGRRRAASRGTERSATSRSA